MDILVDLLSPNVHEYVRKCDTFEAAVHILERRYVRQKIEISRHVLSDNLQQNGQSWPASGAAKWI